jgi:hypothetical protein
MRRCSALAATGGSSTSRAAIEPASLAFTFPPQRAGTSLVLPSPATPRREAANDNTWAARTPASDNAVHTTRG